MRKTLWGMFKGLKISERDIEKPKDFGSYSSKLEKYLIISLILNFLMLIGWATTFWALMKVLS